MASPASSKSDAGGWEDSSDAGLLSRIRALADASTAGSCTDGDVVDCLEMLERVWPGSVSGHSASTVSNEENDALPNGLQRFEVRRLLGQGGFGAVFLVYDQVLQREAALKIPQPAHLGRRELRQRFLREAQAAALLDHPNIVPIYETGEAGPMWYIVSRYCSGPTLAEWLAGLPTPPSPRSAARIIAALADAVHHAHSRGVLHRDLKPSNVLLESSDSDELGFVPKLTDFGLAKRLDEQQAVTRDGALLGTVRYMSPEQARGDDRSIGVQTDVYALGVMLYELISGQPPFHTHDAETLRCIQQEPIPALQTSHGRLSRDLETVCLKCMEKDRAARYESAGEVAAELRRYLAGQTVIARPVSRLTRAVRWCRHEPVVAGLSIAVAALLVAATVGSLIMLQRERELRRRAEWKQEAAIRAVGDFYTDVAENWLATQPKSEGRRKEFLLKALRFYEELAKEQSDDPEVRYRTSVALHRAANIQEHLGMSQAAATDRQRCLAILEGLIADFPQEQQYRYDRFYNLLASGPLHPGGRRQSLELAYNEIRRLVDESPDNPIYLDSMASVSGTYAAEFESEDRATAIRIAKHGVAVAEQLVEKYPDRPLYEKNVATCVGVLVAFEAEEGDFVAAERGCDRCAAIYERLAERFPDTWTLKLQGVGLRASQATYLEKLGKADEAEQILAECFTALEPLQEAYPGEVDIQAQYQNVLWRQGDNDFHRGDEQRAFEKYSRCLAFLESAMAQNPDYAVNRRRLVSYLRECPMESLRNPERAAELERAAGPGR